MKEFIEKLIARLEEIEVENSCYGCTYRTQCNAVQEKVSDETDLCGATIKEVAIEIVNQLAEEYNNDGWIPCSKQLPPHSDDLLLIQCSGKPKNNIVFDNAFCLASYTEEGWTLEMYPDWRDAEVVAWKNLGEPYQPKGE